MDKMYSHYVGTTWDTSNGFFTHFGEFKRTPLSDEEGRELLSSGYGRYITATEGEHFLTKADAARAMIDELHRRIVVIRKQVDSLRCLINNGRDEVAA
jgi:hypothetical protein